MFTKTETIRFRHTDFAGIVFYPRFLEMWNDLVEDWFAEALERPFSAIHKSNGVPTVDLKVRFLAAARIGDVLQKHLWVVKLGKSSVTLGFRFEHVAGPIVLEGEATLVNVLLNKGEGGLVSQPFSEEMQIKIKRYQPQEEL